MDDTSLPYFAELDAAVQAVRAGGAIIRDFYDRAAAATYEKSDGSPVTDADLGADREIRRVLTDRFPEIPILSEEGTDDLRRVQSPRSWIVDPLDGTEQFIRRTGEFDVLVALVEDGRPIVAAGFQPTTGLLVTATAGGGAWMSEDGQAPRRVHLAPGGSDVRLASSKWFGAPENEAIVGAIASLLGVAQERTQVTGFSPRMFLLPREIEVMIGVRPGVDQTMASEWDFAVTDLFFHEAGGKVTDLAGRRFQYNKPIPRNVGGLIATVDEATHERLLAAAATTVPDLIRGDLN